MLSLIFIAAIIAFAACSGVVTLTSDNFESTIKQQASLVKFYAPWCSHCKALEPTWKELANTLTDITVAELDCTEEQELCTTHSVRGFPTIMLLTPEGGAFTFKGAREVAELTSWSTKMLLPSITEMASLEEAHAAMEQENVWFLFQGPDMELFTKVSAPFKGLLSFIHVPAEVSSVTAFRDGSVITTDDLTDLPAFIEANRMPFLPALGPQNFRDLLQRPELLTIICLDPSQHQTALEQAQKAARAHPADSAYTLCYIDAVQWAPFVGQFEFEEHSLPAAVIFDVNGEPRQYFKAPLGDDIEAGLEAFLASHAAGTLPAHSLERPGPQASHTGLSDRLLMIFHTLMQEHLPFVVGVTAVLSGLLAVLVFRKKEETEEEEEEEEEGSEVTESEEEKSEEKSEEVEEKESEEKED
eukprot:gnl/Dysnectes_brevis/1363_a1532_3496.p1 GENE.gnl/Dysnectes_brevis/1363_a1532_3496~~gnl/Dysnectes_brevis/1363_a1532_3496.p1  ORF type:complete len:414 (+),score=165.15 gnl/Dysnectes_brevis/1363_a1532_3496:38-1279(+)